MAVQLTVNGVTYQYPELTDEGWGPDATNWAVAMTQSVLTKAGGLFALTGELDLGPNFGIKSVYYKTRSSNIASAGQFRLSNSDVISFRNSANSGNLNFTSGSSDAIPSWNGVDLVNLTATQTLTNKTLTSPTITSPNISNPTFTGTATFVNLSTSGTTTIGDNIADSLIVNASLASDLIPLTDITYDIGSSSKLWRSTYSGRFFANNGSLASPSYTFVNANSTGFSYSVGPEIDVSVSGTHVAAFGTAAISLIRNTILVGENTSANFVQIVNGTSFTNSSLAISGAPSASNGGIITFFGNTHATYPNAIRFRNGSLETGNLDANGKWTIGESGGSQSHVINGDLLPTGPGGESVSHESLRALSIANNATANVISVAAASNRNLIVDYSITRSTNYETGTLYIVHDGTTAQVAVGNVVSGSPGVTFSADISAGNLRLRYTSDNSGPTGTMKYEVRRWNS